MSVARIARSVYSGAAESGAIGVSQIASYSSLTSGQSAARASSTLWKLSV